MLTKESVINEARKLGFEDVGFTTAAPFEEHKQLLVDMREEYAWTDAVGLDLLNGTDPANIMSDAKTIIVLVEVYFRKAYPRSVEGHFGRCYLDDDRMTRDGLAQRIKAFRKLLKEHGINSQVPFNLPHRVAAARAGLGTFGKNCLFYSNTVTRGGSWTLPIAVVIDHFFSPGQPTIKTDCPDWCRNACIAACPTRALKGNSRIDPRKCISYLSYFGDGITPLELRDAMGMYIYGCDRCQNVCPRNQPWLAQDLPLNEKVVAKAPDFSLSALLHMDRPYFETKIWPHMFYMSWNDSWRWKMNVARVMGNSMDQQYVSDLIRVLDEGADDRVLGMVAWALGKIGGSDALQALKTAQENQSDAVNREIDLALTP